MVSTKVYVANFENIYVPTIMATNLERVAAGKLMQIYIFGTSDLQQELLMQPVFSGQGTLTCKEGGSISTPDHLVLTG